MITVKKNQKFVSEAGNMIRITGKTPRMIQIVNVDNRGRSIKTTARSVKLDSIRRRYNRAA